MKKYYTSAYLFRRFRADVAQYYKNEIDWEEVLLDRDAQRRPWEWIHR
jgi:hypothetical protein